MANLKPPFRAEDMEGLYKKVVKGAFQRLPGHFSVDLNDLVSYMLRVNPQSRLSAEEILGLPMVIEKIKTGAGLKTTEEQQPLMLQTIKFPNNLQYLTDKLPKPNYEPMIMAQYSNYERMSKRTLQDHKKNGHHNVSGIHNASKVNRSIIHESSRVDSKIMLPKLPGAGRGEHGLIKNKMNKQHERLEQVTLCEPSKSRNTMKY
jgi:serine/threonine protein kinase